MWRVEIEVYGRKSRSRRAIAREVALFFFSLRMFFKHFVQFYLQWQI